MPLNADFIVHNDPVALGLALAHFIARTVYNQKHFIFAADAHVGLPARAPGAAGIAGQAFGHGLVYVLAFLAG